MVTGPGGGHDTGSVAWRGAAIMAGLETAQVRAGWIVELGKNLLTFRTLRLMLANPG